MSDTGGNLFGTPVIWARIVAIAIIFVLWSNIISCNADHDSRAREAEISKLATRSSAENYCKVQSREQHSLHKQFQTTHTQSTKMATRGYRVVLQYEFWNGATMRMTNGSETCNLEWRGSDWRSNIIF